MRVCADGMDIECGIEEEELEVITGSNYDKARGKKAFRRSSRMNTMLHAFKLEKR